MGFLDIGFLEVLLILTIALIIFGPGKIPEIATKLGKLVRAFRKATFDLTTAVTKEIENEEKEPPSQPEESGGNKTKKSSDVVKTAPPHKSD